MKKLIVFLILAVGLSAQTFSFDKVFADTISNSKSKTFYVPVNEKADSVTFSVLAKGEADIDRIIVSKGVDGSVGDGFFTPDTTTLSIDVAAGSMTVQKSSNYGLEGTNYIKVVVQSGASGNDASDPNQIEVYAHWFK